MGDGFEPSRGRVLCCKQTRLRVCGKTYSLREPHDTGNYLYQKAPNPEPSCLHLFLIFSRLFDTPDLVMVDGARGMSYSDVDKTKKRDGRVNSIRISMAARTTEHTEAWEMAFPAFILVSVPSIWLIPRCGRDE